MGLIILMTCLFILHPCWHFLSAGLGLLGKLCWYSQLSSSQLTWLAGRWSQGDFRGWLSSFCCFQARRGTFVPSRGFGEGRHRGQLKCLLQEPQDSWPPGFHVLGGLSRVRWGSQKQTSLLLDGSTSCTGQSQRGGRSSFHRCWESPV